MHDLYAEEIIDHYRYPRNKGSMENPDLVYHDSNPFCGDEITIMLKVEDGRVVDVKWQGHGCTISQASASMLSEEIKGKTLGELRHWGERGGAGPAGHSPGARAHQVRLASSKGSKGRGLGHHHMAA